MWIIFAALVGAIGIYLVVRPMLKALPQFRAFYAEADTFRQKVFAIAYNSSTVVVSYAGAAFGFVFSQLDTIASMVGDPRFQTEVSNALGSNPKVLGYCMIGFSAIVFAARMRSIAKG